MHASSASCDTSHAACVELYFVACNSSNVIDQSVSIDSLKLSL